MPLIHANIQVGHSCSKRFSLRIFGSQNCIYVVRVNFVVIGLDKLVQCLDAKYKVSLSP